MKTMNREIPGFYFDSAKRKYFRIEDSRTAPAEAAWSAQNVKRRAVQLKEEKKRQEREERAARRVKRARVRGVPSLGGLLARETGETGAGAMPAAGEEVVRAWTGGLKGKGSVTPWPWVDDGMITGLWVGGSGEQAGPGVLFACGVGDCVAGSWVPRDVDDKIDLGYEPATWFLAPDVTALKFHDTSCSLLLAWEHGGSIGIKRYAPQPSDTNNPSPAFLVNRSSSYMQFDSSLGASTASTIHALEPAPQGSRLTCIAGTDQGIIRLQDDKLDWLTPSPPPRSHPNQRRKQGRPGPSQLPWQGDILSVDFAHHNPTEVILAGTRSSHICLLDLRVPVREWTARSTTFTHISSVARLRSVGPHEILAAGPRNAMAIYDIRFLRQASPPPPPPSLSRTYQQTKQEGAHHPWRSNATRPIVEFPAYRNAAHIHTGLDVLAEPGYGSRGIVAAAHDDETVGLYSLLDGTRIPGGAVDSIKAGAVVRSMMWATLPGDRHPGLFVGEGTCVKKYSFWA